MNNINKKYYSIKRPAHPDDAHTKSKSFFKRKGRKRLRQILKKDLNSYKNFLIEKLL